METEKLQEIISNKHLYKCLDWPGQPKENHYYSIYRMSEIYLISDWEGYKDEPETYCIDGLYITPMPLEELDIILQSNSYCIENVEDWSVEQSEKTKQELDFLEKYRQKISPLYSSKDYIRIKDYMGGTNINNYDEGEPPF